MGHGHLVLLTPAVTVVVHPIDTEAHPTVPPGWRWAVMLGAAPLEDMDACANAGWCPTEREAWLEGEMVAVAVAKALRAYGVPADYRTLALERDPIPAGADRVSVGG